MRLLFSTLCFLTVVSFASAQEVVSEVEDIAVYAEVCEKINPQESKAAARTRATDKASFKAVEDIPDLEKYRSQLDVHNFNLKIYRLIDNYLEDIKTSVTQQTEAFVCVEVNAFLPEESIVEVFEEAEVVPQEAEDKVLTLDVEAPLDEGAITIPPKPEIVINQEIAYNSDVSVPLSSETEEAQAFRPLATKVFVDKTEFYNGTDTNGFFTVIERKLHSKKGIVVLSQKDNPDYIIRTKILKAKVENVNSETGRLQIVAAADLIDTKTSEVTTEHLNKFELFNLSDDSQRKASDVSRKLFEELLEKLLPLIKTNVEEGQLLPSVITPN